MHLNLIKRYKWAFLPQYDSAIAKPVGHPNLKAFLDASARILAVGDISQPHSRFRFSFLMCLSRCGVQDETHDPSAAFKSAYDTFYKLCGEGRSEGEVEVEGEGDGEGETGAESGSDAGVSERSVSKSVGWAGRWSDERMKVRFRVSLSINHCLHTHT